MNIATTFYGIDGKQGAFQAARTTLRSFGRTWLDVGPDWFQIHQEHVGTLYSECKNSLHWERKGLSFVLFLRDIAVVN
jgi:hypothetical protein